MAENDTGEKTEDPSAKRISQSRQDGMVGKSADLGQLVNITAAFLALQYVGPSLWGKLKMLFIYCFSYEVYSDLLMPGSLREKLALLFWFISPEILLLVGVAAVAGTLTVAIQTKFLWSWKLLKPKFSNLNPLQGLKRLAGKRNIFNILKSILKLAIIAPVTYFAFMGLFPQIVSLMASPIDNVLPFVAEALAIVFWDTAKFLLALSILDFAWQKYTTARDLKMTKVETKEERKSQEGDEQSKSQMKARAMARIRQRIFQEVPKADVVVTNPTHFAVALRYDPKVSDAPIVVAKGSDRLAARIREIAEVNGVPVVERKMLARALYQSVQVGQSIPHDLYAAVAELLAFVYKLKGKNPLAKKRVEASATT